MMQSVVVFPARAGINRVPWRARPVPARLPRARGDQPAFALSSVLPLTSSPRARGSTHGDRLLRLPLCVFPARAGINPAGSRWGGRRRGLPRARGDQPATLTPDGA